MKKYLLILILAVTAAVGGFFWTKGNLLQESKVAGVQNSPTTPPTAKPTPNYPKTVGEFLVTDKEICQEDGKPLAYFFGSSSCPHCVWEKSIAQKVFAKFKNEISYHENFDSDKDSEVFRQYSDINPGYVPFLVLGCRYARVGAGENLGPTEEESKKLEEEALTVLVCKLTDGKPNSACGSLKDKVSEIP